MKASELRIGNWVIGDNGNRIEQVTASDLKWIAEKNNLHEGTPLVEPIVLNEVWLQKLGFEKTTDLGDMIYYEPIDRGLRRYAICNNHSEWQFMLVVRDEYTILIHDEEHFQYIHQLQNLWHSLTGKELQLQNKLIVG